MLFDLVKKNDNDTNLNTKMPLTKYNVICFLSSLGIDVKTNTKARGNNGIYIKNRIDVANGLDDEKAIEVLIHEFAHYIHSKIDNNFYKTGGCLENIFNTSDIDKIKSELVNITNIIDKDTKLKSLINIKEEISNTIKSLQKSIQCDYPKFQRSKKFKEFEKYVKNSEAKYLAKYDAIRIRRGIFSKKEVILRVSNVQIDFPKMPRAFQSYIKLCSFQRKQLRISRRLNRLNKYFNKPTELFARFVQSYFLYPDMILKIAPNSTARFKLLLNQGYYKELKNFFYVFKGNIL